MPNVLTDYLAERYPEAAPEAFYRDLFPSGRLGSREYEDGSYNGVLVRVLRREGEPERAERHPITDDLLGIATTATIAQSFGGEFDIVSPASYAGRRPMLDRAHELFALVFDLDGVRVDDGEPVGLADLLYQMADVPGARPALLPTPTYIVSSGTGLHLYYMLDEPIRVWPNVCEALRVFRNALTRRCWNQYVTDLSDVPQLESVVQGFRMVGSMAKDGEQVVRAFRVGGRVSMEYMNRFVPEDARVPRGVLRASHTVEEAHELWPEWDPDWRRKAAAAPETPWRVKRDLFDWWCRRVEAGEPFDGNRYWCIFVAACYAAKCPDVTYEELEAWAHRVRPMLDAMTTKPHNGFTEKDVQDALAVYGNPVSVKLRRDKVAEKTQLPMPVNKRNGRKRSTHIAIVNNMRKFARDELGEDSYANNGRPKGSGVKRDMIRDYAAEHPGSSHSAIARALGVSRPTVIKWLKPGWREEWERQKEIDAAKIVLRRDEDGRWVVAKLEGRSEAEGRLLDRGSRGSRGSQVSSSVLQAPIGGL